MLICPFSQCYKNRRELLRAFPQIEISYDDAEYVDNLVTLKELGFCVFRSNTKSYKPFTDEDIKVMKKSFRCRSKFRQIFNERMLNELQKGELSGRFSIALTSVKEFGTKFNPEVARKSDQRDEEVHTIMSWIHAEDNMHLAKEEQFTNKLYQTLLYSRADSDFQLSHWDYHIGQMPKAYSVFLSLEGMTLMLFPTSHLQPQEVAASGDCDAPASISLLYPKRLYVPPNSYLVIDAGMVHSGCVYSESNIRLHWFAYNPELGKDQYGSFEPNNEFLWRVARVESWRRREWLLKACEAKRAAAKVTKEKKKSACMIAREAKSRLHSSVVAK